MCRPGDTEHMLVDTTWGILHFPICTRSSVLIFTTVQYNSTFLVNFNRPSSLQLDGVHKLTLKSLVSLRIFFQRPSLKKGLGKN